MKNKIIAAAVAGALLVGAGLVTAALGAPSIASAQEESTDSDDWEGHRGFTFLSEVLADLVEEGTIDQSDADAILAAAAEKAEEIWAERNELRELIHDMLEDGVITESEAEQLPDDHPFLGERFDEAWEDGELTVDEIRELTGHHRGRAFRRGARLGALLDDGGIDETEWSDLLSNLPEDHPFNDVDLSGYLDDGLITVDELREIRQALHDAVTSGSTT